LSRFQRTRTPAACCCRDGCGTPMGGGDIGVNGSAVGVELLGVSGPQKPEFSPIWIEERLRTGGTAEYRPNPRPALLLEVINDRGESHFHQTMHRGGRALPGEPAWPGRGMCREICVGAARTNKRVNCYASTLHCAVSSARTKVVENPHCGESVHTAVCYYPIHSYYTAIVCTAVEWGGPKSDRSSSIALLNTMCVEDWAILGLETVLAGVLTEHPAVS
jgi:hypothetical protein